MVLFTLFTSKWSWDQGKVFFKNSGSSKKQRKKMLPERLWILKMKIFNAILVLVRQSLKEKIKNGLNSNEKTDIKLFNHKQFLEGK